MNAAKTLMISSIERVMNTIFNLSSAKKNPEAIKLQDDIVYDNVLLTL